MCADNFWKVGGGETAYILKIYIANNHLFCVGYKIKVLKRLGGVGAIAPSPHIIYTPLIKCLKKIRQVEVDVKCVLNFFLQA